MTALPYSSKIHITSAPHIRSRVSIIEMGDNYQQRIETGLNPEWEEWSITWPALTDTELRAAMVILAAARSVLPLTWVSPLDGLTKKYIVVPDSKTIVSIGALWRLSLNLRQVFEP